MKNIGKLYAYDLFAYVTKTLLANFLKRFQGSSFFPRLSRDLFSTGGKQKFANKVIRAYLTEFSIFFHKIFMVARSRGVLAADIKSLLVSALVNLETRLKVLTIS